MNAYNDTYCHKNNVDCEFKMYVVVVLILAAAKWRTIVMTGWTVLKTSICLGACLEVKSMKVPRLSPRLTTNIADTDVCLYFRQVTQYCDSMRSKS